MSILSQEESLIVQEKLPTMASYGQLLLLIDQSARARIHTHSC